MERTGIGRVFSTLGTWSREMRSRVGRVLGRARRARVSVRMMMGLVLVIAVYLGWQMNGAREQRAAVSAIEALGGSVSYDIEYRNAGPSPYREGSWSPMQWFDGDVEEYRWLSWLIETIGIDHFANVVHVQIDATSGGPRADDETLVHLGRLRRLASLHLRGAAITDDGLRHLSGLRRLWLLQLHHTGISDAGLVHLHEVDSLRVINVLGTEVTDAGVDALDRALPEGVVDLGELSPPP